MTRDNAKTAGGFTLLELLVVVVIITLMSALVAPRILGSLAHMNLKTEAKRMAAAMRYARSQAVSEQATYVASFDLAAERLTVARVEAEKAADTPPAAADGENGGGASSEAGNPPPAPLVYTLPEGIVLQKTEAGNELFPDDELRIEFYPDGNSSGGEILLADERDKRYIVWVDFISGTVGTDVCGENCQ
jgi:general secretion pathway protein H